MEPQEKTATCLQEGLMTRLQERAGRWKSMIVKGLKEEFVKALQNWIGIENLKFFVLEINPMKRTELVAVQGNTERIAKARQDKMATEWLTLVLEPQEKCVPRERVATTLRDKLANFHLLRIAVELQAMIVKSLPGRETNGVDLQKPVVVGQ
jgi:hypothetical protein